MSEVEQLTPRARAAAAGLALASTAAKNAALVSIHEALIAHAYEIMATNAAEVEKARAEGLDSAFCDRLAFTTARFEEMTSGLLRVAALSDPVGEREGGRRLPNGLELIRQRVPLGVVGIIYEARPNVTVDIAALCLKSGNACMLRGGRECQETNALLYGIMREALRQSELPEDSVLMLSTPDRAEVTAMLRADRDIDVIIPRGGEKLFRICREQATVPLIEGGFGISHIFADASCDVVRAVPLIINSKVQKPSACNALDTLLLHPDIAGPLLEKLLPELAARKVGIIAHGEALDLCAGYEMLRPGAAADFDTEFLSLNMNIALTPSVEAAVAHLRAHGGRHSDSILTNDRAHAEYFVNAAPSACVYVNAATRFTDGGQFGFGAEVAISTQKLHARGPMGLAELTTYKYVGTGDYLCRR